MKRMKYRASFITLEGLSLKQIKPILKKEQHTYLANETNILPQKSVGICYDPKLSIITILANWFYLVIRTTKFKK